MWAGNADDEAGIFGVLPCRLVWKRENGLLLHDSRFDRDIKH